MAKKTESAQTTVRRIRRKTRKKYSAEDKIRIVIEGLGGELSVAELCRKEGELVTRKMKLMIKRKFGKFWD
jgi:transposase